MAYLFFVNKQGRQGLTLEATHAMRAHVGEVFSQWISHSVHFTVNPIPLAEGWHHAMTASERCRHQSWAEYPGKLVPNLASSKSDSNPQLVGSAPLLLQGWVQQETRGVDRPQGHFQAAHKRSPKP